MALPRPNHVAALMADKVHALRLMPRELRFCLLYKAYRNADRAAREAGYPYKQGHRIRTRPRVAAALKLLASEELYTIETLRELLGVQAFGDMADYEPFLDGKASLEDLRAAGFDTRQVKRSRNVTRTIQTKEGEIVTVTREIELHDAQTAIQLLLRSSDRINGGPDDNPRQQAPTVNVTLYQDLGARMLAVADKPFCPGLAPLPPLLPDGGCLAKAQGQASPDASPGPAGPGGVSTDAPPECHE